MAASKLTLSIDSELIEKAKSYASKHHTSVSKLFSDFVNKVTTEGIKEEDDFLKKLKEEDVSPQIEALRGILKGKVPADKSLADLKYERLKEKYDL
jgi:hypothetical protein